MKKLAVLVTLLLVFLLAVQGSVLGRNLTPPGVGDNLPTGDDHPWGGDEATGGNSAVGIAPAIVVNIPALNAFLYDVIGWFSVTTRPEPIRPVPAAEISTDRVSLISLIPTQRMKH